MKLIALALLAACTTNGAPQTQSPNTEKWIIYTHATCGGNTVDGSLPTCVIPSPADTALRGDAEATYWANLWVNACNQLQGELGTPEDSSPCSDGGGNPWACTVDLVDVGEGCAGN